MACETSDNASPATTVFEWQDFIPRRGLRNGHLQTIAGNFLPRRLTLPEPTSLLVEVEGPVAGYGPTQVLCHCHWQNEGVRAQRLSVVLVHGLEGSSSSQYVLGNAARAWNAGMNVVRMNMRSCGGTEELSPTIYHSGRSEDVAAVVEALVAHGAEAIALVGYSMGGNLVLKYAGELGADLRPEVRALAGVSPLLDLAPSSDALHEFQNRIYERRFLRAMLARVRRKAKLFPELYSTQGLETIRSMRDFDGQIVARYGGFRDADDYYASVASSQWVASLPVPTLIIHSLDDPFLRMLPETRNSLLTNPHIRYLETKHGGHCAFLEPAINDDGYWAEKTLLNFLRSVAV